MILHYLHTVVASEYWKTEQWQLWADKLLLQNDEFVEWIYDVAVARSKEELYLAIAYEKIIEVVDKERFYWEPDVVIGYYYLMYKEGRIDLAELFLKLFDEDDISSEAELFDFPEIVQMLNKAKIGEMDIEKIDKILYPLARIANEQLEVLKQYTNNTNGKELHYPINIFLNKSEKMRKGYLNSLEKVDLKFKQKWLENFEFLPTFFEEIYSVCNGTRAEISEQKYFDFLPGFRLMQVDEIIELHKKKYISSISSLKYEIIIPFLNDYSSCYYAYAKVNDKECGKECIVFISDGEIEIIHSDINLFWKTIIAFYDEDVYFLDNEGFLSYDSEKESEIGKKYNIGIEYWN